MKIRDRIVELRRVPGNQLAPNPKNWRTHPESQMNAIRGVLAEVGFAGAHLARVLPDGSLQLIDGHARAEIVGDAVVPVLVTDLTEAEAALVLATFDPIGAMATANAGALDALLRDVSTGNEALSTMLAELAKEAGLYETPAEPVESPEDFKEVDENIETEHTCPKCGYAWSGGK